MDTVNEKINKYINDNREYFTKKLQELIRCPSLTGEEKSGQVYMKQWMEELKLEIDEWEPDVEELFKEFGGMAQYPSSWKPELDLPLQFEDKATWEQLKNSVYADKLTYKDRPNLAGILKGSGGGSSLLLNGHIDVVTVEPAEFWSREPFGAQIEGDKMYGRGTSDMKGGVAAIMAAVETLVKCGITLSGDVIVESVVNEEHSGNGSLACVQRGYKADAAIVPEATGINNYAVKGGGGVYWQIKLKGKEAHTGSRWKNNVHNGISAIEKTPFVINSLLELERKMNREKPVFYMGIGKIAGGAYATSTARECVLEGVLYFSSDAGTGEAGIVNVKKMIREAVEKCAEEDSWLKDNPPLLTFSHYDDAFENNEKDGIAEVIKAAAGEVLGKELQEVRVSATDARHLANRKEGIPVVVYGPGDMGRAHSIDEYINISEYIEYIKILANTVYRWCR